MRTQRRWRAVERAWETEIVEKETFTNAAIRSTLAIVILTVGLVVAPGATSARAQSSNAGSTWWSVGSTGIADESSAALFSFNGATASLRSSAPTGTVAIIRYPVTLVPGLLFSLTDNTSPSWPVLAGPYGRLHLSMNFVKNDDGAYVAASLKRIRLSDGAETPIAGVNSLAAIPSAGPQSVGRTISCAAGCMDPYQFAYYVEAVFWKPTATSDPKLSALRVHLSQ